MNGLDAADNTQVPAGLTLADYLRIARSRWKITLALSMALTVLAYCWTLQQPRIYASQSSALVVAASDTVAMAKAAKYQSVGQSRLVAERVVESLDLKTSPGAILGSVTVAVLPDAQLAVTATSADPATAQRVADAWVAGLVEQVKEMESIPAMEGADAVPVPAVRAIPLGEAVLPTAPIAPDVKKALGLGALGGLILGLLYALLRHYLDRRLRNAAAIERRFGVSVLGTLPVDHRLDGKSTILEHGFRPGKAGKGSHAITEALRELRTNLQYVDVDNPPRIIVVTSALPAEGKSTVTANLAVTIAATGENIVVVDGDLRRPTTADVFDLIPGVGVTDVLSGNAELADVLQEWSAMPNLRVLGSGRIPPNPSELLGSLAMKKLLQTLAEDAIVLVDAPPLLPVTDAAILTRISDGAIVVVRSGETTEDELGKALGNMERVNGHVLGVILNRVPTSGADSYSYYSAYQSLEAEPDPNPSPQPQPSHREPAPEYEVSAVSSIPDESPEAMATRSRRSFR